MTGSDNNPLSDADSAFFTVFVARAVEYLVGTGMSERQALYVLDLSLTPSQAYMKYKTWSPTQRDDVARALERAHPEGGLLNIVAKAYKLAEERVAKLRAVEPPSNAASVRQQALDATALRVRDAGRAGFIAGLAVLAALVLVALIAAYVAHVWPFQQA